MAQGATLLDYLNSKGITDLNFIRLPHREPFIFNENDWERVKKLGEGSFGDVYKYIHVPSKKEIAFKISRGIPKHDYENVVRQINLHSNLSTPGHRNVTGIYGHLVFENRITVFMEIMDCSLQDVYLLIYESDITFPEELLGYVTVSVVDAQAYCKDRNIIHRDLKPKNILLNFNGEIKLCDFDMSRFLDNSYATSNVGTIAYWPPERFFGVYDDNYDPRDAKYDVRADIWSLGITMVEVIRGKHPFKNENTTDNNHPQSDLIGNQNKILDLSHNENVEKLLDECLNGKTYSVEVRKFVAACLEDIKTRPKYNALIEMKFYNDYASMTVPSNVRRALKKVRF